MKYEDFKAAVIAAAQSEGLTDYELYYVSDESTSVDTFGHEVKSFTDATSGGACFRCIAGGKMGYASTEQLSEETARAVVLRAKENAAVLETEEEVFLSEGGKTYADVRRKAYPLPTPEKLIETVLAGQKAIYAADSAVIDGSETGAETFRHSVAIYNSRGLDVKSDHSGAVYYTVAVVSDGNEMNDSYEIRIGSFDELDIPAAAAKAAADAKSKLGAGVAPTGNYPVIFAPKAMADLLTTFSGVFSAENARKGFSRLMGKEGETIAAPCVTLTDDPFYADAPMPMAFDAEGSPTFTKDLVENGVLKTLLHNLKSAAAMGKTTTGNAAKRGYNGAVEIRPFTLFLAPGDLTEEELLARAGNGVYIDFLGGLHAGANPISGDFSLQSAGYMIENGKKTRAVRSFTVAGNFYDLLKQITAVANNIELRNMGSVTGFAAPAVLVNGLSVAGE